LQDFVNAHARAYQEKIDYRSKTRCQVVASGRGQNGRRNSRSNDMYHVCVGYHEDKRDKITIPVTCNKLVSRTTKFCTSLVEARERNL
jgi:hypothetical protein